MNLKEQSRSISSRATDELKSAVKQIADKRFGFKPETLVDIQNAEFISDISDYLFMKVIDGPTLNSKYRFILNKYMLTKETRLANAEYKYSELLGTIDNETIDGDNTIDDFNGSYIDIYAELVKVDKQIHKKIKIPDMVLSNAWLVAEKMVEFVDLQVKEMDFAVEKYMENLAWKTVLDNSTSVDVENGTQPIEYFRTLTKQLERYKTTSKNHLGIGTEGVITIKTVSGDKTINPNLYFDINEFVLIANTDELVDYKFDTDAVIYHNEVLKLGLNIIPLSFNDYSGFESVVDVNGTEILPAIELPAGTKMILLHKESIHFLKQYEVGSTVRGAHAFSIQHKYAKLGTYKVKTKPILLYKETSTETLKVKSK